MPDLSFKQMELLESYYSAIPVQYIAIALIITQWHYGEITLRIVKVITVDI